MKSAMKRIKEEIPDAIIDLRYMTENNFMGEKMYERPYDYLRSGTLDKLKVAARQLRDAGYRVIIWDAYRPLEVQWRFWNKIQDERFIAHPKKGSSHNRGCAVDLTLASLEGEELKMPTAFDAFDDQARSDRLDPDAGVALRLKLLQKAMKDAGFQTIPDEWWHFTDTDWNCYKIE